MAGLDRSDEGVVLRLDEEEVDVVASLAEGLAVRLADPTPDGEAGDELLERLAPTASRGDAELDAELRSLLREDLMTSRVARLRDLATGLRGGLSAGTYVRTLDRAEAMRIVEALNDLRIALASTIGYERIERGGLAVDDPRQDTLRLMDALAWLQGGLIEYVDGD